RLESRINFIVSNKGKTEYYQELAWMLELVEKGEFILNVISDRIESVQYLDEFMTIMNNVSSSISEVRDDVEQTVEAAEASLSGLHDAISKVSTRLLPDLRQEIEPVLVSELSTVFAPGKINTANSMANEATVRGATEREEYGKGERKEEAESMMA
ncbi:MAG: hypothetical protein QOK81_06760, partial [Nitrososphaeraceae archaeon]|nr:hypothetical protein [Nitrososphaeraceae archaeon]